MSNDRETPEIAPKGWALFDLDQTIVPWDLQVLFCNFVIRREGWRRVLLLPFFALLPLAKVLGSEVMKRTFMGFAYGMERACLETLAKEFASEVVETLCYPEVLTEFERHRQAGHRTILVSASPELYVCEIGRRLGFDEVFGTVVDVGERLAWFPEFPLGNNKSANKVVRLRDELGLAGVLPNSEGYSDSKADLPMLAMCEKVVAIHPEGAFAEKAKAGSWRVLHPEKPWRNRSAFAVACLKMMLGIYSPQSGENKAPRTQ